MKLRRIYYRKKGKSIVLEGRLPNKKSELIWTLPDANKFISQIIENASLIPLEKLEKIKEKYMRLDFKTEPEQKRSPKVRANKIRRTEEKDAET
ncbi:hypothetical protein J4462_03690 [Candidatus Pacearchaeota archaeon]|nr:hypothetical protein [Candidatus Pacearchaeota archaeon]